MKPTKTFLALMMLAFIGYSLGLWALNIFYDKDSEFRYLLILLPMAPTFYVVLITIRVASQADEMQTRIMLEAIAFSAVATALTCMSYSFFRDMGAPEFKAYWAWGLIWIFYIIGLVWSKWRYR